MSTALREIKRRIGTTRQIHNVTTALQRVSMARLQRERREIANAEQYAGRLAEAIACVRAASGAAHPLLRPGAATGAAGCAVLFGADRGLCGGFNTMLVEALVSFGARETTGRLAQIVAVGAVVERKLRKRGLRASRALAQPTGAERPVLLRRLAEDVTAGFLAGRCRSVHLVYGRFHSALNIEPLVEPLLPLVLPPSPPAGRRARFEPPAGVLLDDLLPELVLARIERAYAHSVGSENAARQTAMSRASRNASDLLDGLAMQYSRVRQENITTEMIELIGGGAN